MGYVNYDNYNTKQIQTILSTLLLNLNEVQLNQNEENEIENIICYICNTKYIDNLNEYRENVYQKFDKKSKNTIDEIDDRYSFFDSEQSFENISMEKYYDKKEVMVYNF